MSEKISRRQFVTLTASTAAAIAAPINVLAESKTPTKTITNRLTKKNMNVLVLHGSPKENGNTAGLVDIATEELKKKGHTVTRMNAVDMEVEPCIACMECQKSGNEFYCINEDDGTKALKAMIEADAIIITSPLYFAAFTAHIKPLIDRSFAMSRKFGTKQHFSFVADKPVLFLSTGAGPYKNNGEILEGSCNDYVRFLKLDKVDFFYASSKPAVSEAKKQELRQLVAAL